MFDSSYKYKSGFTLTEILVSVAISSLVMLAAITAFIYAWRETRAGGYQVRFTSMARNAEEKIIRYIEEGKAIGVKSDEVDIVTVDLKMARIYFSDADNNLDTIEDNALIYDPDTSVSGDEVTIVTHVTPISGEPMFKMVPTSPNSVEMTFHIGDSTNVSDTIFSGTGYGFQGVEVRLAATPRNIQRWYDK